LKRELEEHFNMCKPCIKFLKTYSATSKICRQVVEENLDEECAEELKKFLRNKLST